MQEISQQPYKIMQELTEMEGEMQREQIPLSPEMKELLEKNLESLMSKMKAGESIYKEDLKFIAEIREWFEVQKLIRKLGRQYDDAVNIAKMLGKSGWRKEQKVPSKEEVVKQLSNLPKKKLKEIMSFDKPQLLMTPPTTMAEKEKKMNANKPYADENGQTQDNMYFGEDKNSDLWNPRPSKLIISVTDGAPSMPQLPPELVSKKWGERYKAVYEEYKKKGVQMITAHEYAVLMQMSLMEYKKAKEDENHPNHDNPEALIADFCKENWTYTAFYQPEQNLTELEKVPCGNFSSGNRRVSFYWGAPTRDYDYLRFRPSVQVFEF